MKLKNLEYFEKLIELKNYSSVAEYFKVGQPTVSMGIKRLEQDAGYNLVVHSANYNELILTPAGKRFHKYSKEIIKQLKLLKKEIRHHQQNFKVNFGMPPMVDYTYFSKLAKKLKQKTLTNLNVIENNSNELIKMLKNGTIDVAMLASVKPIKLKGFKSVVLIKDDFKVAVSKNNPLANRSQIKFDDVDSAKVIQMADGYIQSNIFNKIKQKRFSNPDVVYRTSDYKMLKQLVKEDVGISFLLSHSVSPEDEIEMIEADNKIPSVYISLVYPTGYDSNPFRDNLIETILDSFKINF